MPKYDKKIISEEAKEKGFIRDGYEKAKRLVEVLRFISGTKELQNSLALKGGTAINFTASVIPRLSVDVDLDLTENLSRETMLNKRARMYAIFDRFMSAEGYSLNPKSKRPYSLDSLVYAYTNSGGTNDNIKIEINYSMRCHILPTEVRDITWVSDDDQFQINALSPIETYASKIGAFISRGAARDLFDLNGMVESGLFMDDESKKMLRKVTSFYKAVSSGEPFSADGKLTFPTVSDRKVKTYLNPMLRISEYFEAGAAYERVTKYLSALFHFTDRENQFSDEFRNSRYRPELLFDDTNILARIENHPMAIWRVTREEPERER
jgi:predicted nucleotidyltransferase component of viral defense system